MAVNITATRTSSLFNDQDGDGVFDPGDVIITRIRITNSGSDPATGVTAEDTLNGVTLVPGSVEVTPIAYDDSYNLTGNTPITISAAQGLLLNDVDPDGVGGNAGLTVTSVDTTGTQGTVAFNADGSFTFTPTTGFVGITSFKYYIQDAQGRGNVTEGIVTMTVTDKVWYVDNTYGGQNGASDGSYMKPFTSLTPLNNNGADPDGPNDTIFVYHNGGSYTAGITLEAGQKLLGDGVAFMVNGHNIGGTERTGGVDNVSTNAVISVDSGAVVTLATDNTVRGLTLHANTASAIGMADGNGSVTTNGGTLTVNAVSFTGIGQAIDIDQGGNLAMTVDSLSSTGSSGMGVQFAGTASSGTGLITGTVNITTGTISGSTTGGFVVGASGGGTASSGGDVNITYGGVLQSNNGTSVEIQDRTGGTINFNGNINHSTIATKGVLADGNTAGTVNFNGQSISISTSSANGVELTNNTGATFNFAPAGGGTGFDVATGSGKGFIFTGGGTLNVTGTANSVSTGTGQVLDFQNGTMGTNGIQFATLGSTGTVAGGNAVNILNIDAAGGGTFQGGAVTVAGTSSAGADGINITSSNATFTFTSATIDNTTGDGIEINGQTQTQGAVTFGTVDIDATTGVGLSIAGATNAVNVNGGTIGSTNDPAGDAVNINGGTGTVTVAASVTKNSATGNQVVDIANHATGAIQFTGAINSSGGSAGIRIANNSSGNIDFTNSTVNLNTGTFNGIDFTNTAVTGANVTFTGGGLNIDTTTGTGINATNTTVGAGSLTISGAANSVASTSGRAINVDGVTLNATLHDVSVNATGLNSTTTTGVFLKNTGSGGQFIITGDVGTSNQGSGGTIANITGTDAASVSAAPAQGTGIYLENVSNVSIANMIFGANGGTMNNFAIRGENVNNFTLTDSEFRGDFGTNTAHDEGIMRFGTQGSTTGLTGTALFQGNNVGVGGAGNDGALEVGLAVFVYGSNTLNLTIRDTPGGDQAIFGHNNTSSGTDGFLLESGGTSNVTVTVTGVQFTGSRGDLMQVASTGNTVQNISITGNQFLNGQTTTLDGGAGVAISGSLTGGTVTYNIDGNTFKGSRGSNIFSLFNGSSGTVNGIVNNNTFGTENNSVDASQANYASLLGGAIFAGIDSKFAGSGTFNYALRFSNNNIQDIGVGGGGSPTGILLRSANQGTDGTARLEATISNNSIDEVGSITAAGIYAQPGGSGHVNGDDGLMGLNISNNQIDMTGSVSDGIYLDNGSSAQSVAYFPGLASATSNPTTFTNYFLGKGNTFTGGNASGGGGAGINGTATPGNFVLPVPAFAANPNAGLGWQDLADSPVAAPPRDPDPVVTSDEPATGDSGSGGGGSAGGAGGSGGTDPGGSSGDPAPAPADDNVLTQAELDLLVEAAIQRWIDAGATESQVAAMRSVKVGIVDMAGIYAGTSNRGEINVDMDGAGYGWFVDPTPGDDSEFSGTGSGLKAVAGGAAAGKLDLLTVLMHELGHQIGLEDEYSTAEADELMYGYVNVGERRLPDPGEADGAVPGTVGSTAYSLTPVNVGTLPGNKAVDVFFRSTINSQTDGFIVNLNNTSTIKGTNFSDVTANEVNTLDSLTLGSHVFIDANGNNQFDSGEGVAGVALQLYADTNDSGGWDAGDALLGNATTGVGGVYSFSGLAPGDYIVVVTAANFSSGQPLHGRQIVSGVAADPDDNVDNDNHGVAATGGAVASQTITLSYNDEPDGTPQVDGDADADTNMTLDFGFVAPNTAPVNSVPGAQSVNEDLVLTFNAANSNLISVSDADAGSGNITVTLSIADGVLTPASGSGATLGGTPNNVTITGTVAQVNAALNGLTYQGPANTSGGRTLTVTTNDNGNTGADPGLTGTPTSEEDSDPIAITINSVNDAPEGGTGNDASPTEGTVYTFLTTDFSDGMTDPNDSPANAFAGVKITTLPGAGIGVIKLNGVAISAGDLITKAQLDNGELTFDTQPGTASNGTTFTFQVQDNGGTANGGVDLDPTPNTFMLTVTAGNGAPALDLDADDSVAAGTGFSGAYTEGGAAAAISDTDVSITDSDSGDDIVSATITITNPETGDKLNVGTLPATVTVDPSSTDTMVVLVAAAGTSADDFEAAIEAVTLSSTSNNPTDFGTNLARSISVVVNDGVANSNVATATIAVTDVNDPPEGGNSINTILEDASRLLAVVDFGFDDDDSASLASVTISGVTGGGIYFDADGTAGAGVPVLATLPQTYTRQDLIDGKVSFRPDPNLNGTAAATVTFTVTDEDGADAASSNVMTFDITAQNDTPVMSATSPVAATEQVPTLIFTGASVSDVDLDAKNGGNGDYAGAVISVNRNPASDPVDDFELVPGANFTIDGIDLKAGGLIFGHINADANGIIAITFTSLQTIATSALVDEVIQSIRYSYTGDTPPASVQLSLGITDGSPGGGQGGGATGTDNELVTVNITAVDDSPAVAAADTTVSGTEDQNLVFNSGLANLITVSDVDSSTLTVTLTVTKGKLTLSQTTGLSVTGDGTATVELTGSAVDINAALNGLVYRGNLNYEGADTLSVEVDDGNSTDTETIAITLADDGIIHGDTSDNTLTGTPNPDLFMVQQGANDTVSGLGSDDLFYFGAAFTGADSVDGGAGDDVVVLQGNYTLTLSGTNIANLEAISLQSGAKTTWGDTANNFYDYDITTVDGNVPAGRQLIVNGQSLRVGEDFTFDGSAETDGKFLLFGGRGVDTLTGGAGGDVFVFAGDRWGAGDSVDGGGGRDALVISAGNGTTHINFGPNSLTSIEAISVSNVYTSTPAATPSYEFVLDNGNVAAGATLIVNGSSLANPTQTFSVDGSDVEDGKLMLFGGAGTDVLIGGDQADLLMGGGNNDTLTGGAGNDVFRYDDVSESADGDPDTITDFSIGDLIDLSRIDADTTQDGNQAFNFIGSNAFSNQAGELRYENVSGTQWRVEGDTDGNGTADFELILFIGDLDPITAGDFIP